MSAIRTYGPDGRPTWRVVDDGAYARASHAGSIQGAFVVGGPDSAEMHRKTAREYKAATSEKAAAANHAYYLANKATIMAKQRERRRLVKAVA